MIVKRSNFETRVALKILSRASDSAGNT